MLYYADWPSLLKGLLRVFVLFFSLLKVFVCFERWITGRFSTHWLALPGLDQVLTLCIAVSWVRLLGSCCASVSLRRAAVLSTAAGVYRDPRDGSQPGAAAWVWAYSEFGGNCGKICVFFSLSLEIEICFGFPCSPCIWTSVVVRPLCNIIGYLFYGYVATGCCSVSLLTPLSTWVLMGELIIVIF